MSLDREGRPVPWITYSALLFLRERINPEMDIFEFGSGQSTLWWAQRVRSVKACEHDSAWVEAIRARLPTNAEIIFRPVGNGYAEAILNDNREYDIVVIDGRERVKCMRTCTAALKPGGVVIVDNSERAEYLEGMNTLRERGFRELQFDGPGPVVATMWRTSVFYRSGGNVLRI
ncbi:MAG: class I SAM-dependent methyltransferase [Hyphomonadaceae bacterium]|nr:class I SAM-dependent methyltransferase [Hyphomonadaceae bacterium]